MKRITKWYKWSVTNSKDGIRIRRYRYINGKVCWNTFSREKYSHILPSDIPNFVNQLNVQTKASEIDPVKSNKYISDRSLASFRVMLENKINSTTHVNDLMSVLKHHSIYFFSKKLNLDDINEWITFETDFGKYLLSLKYSASHVKRIIQVTNRFFKFLNKTNPEVKLVTFEPLSHFKLKVQKNERRKFISEFDYKRILKSIKPELIPHVVLAYSFGLRCSEIFGLSTDDMFEDCIEIKRQQVDLKNTKDLKNKNVRSIPYWFLSANDTFKQILALKPMHQDTLSKLFISEVKKLGYDYQFHDLRRTFITNAIRVKHYRDVQLAAGHSDLKTTMLYAQDDRLLQRKKFTPVLSSVGL